MKKVMVILFLLIAITAYGQQKFALVIGNSNYTHFGSLRNPINDANDIATALQNLGFTVDKILDGSLNQMETATIRLKNRLTEAGNNAYGFFYYAGHGVQVDGQNYLIPANANIPDRSFLRDRAFPMQAMLDMLNDAGNSLNIVILDACRDFPAAWSRSLNRGLSVVARQPAHSIIVYATSADKVALDGTSNNGLFTSHLLNHLTTPGIEVKDIFNRTGNDVSVASNGEQIPAIYSQFFRTAYLGTTPTSTLVVTPPVVNQPTRPIIDGPVNEGFPRTGVTSGFNSISNGGNHTTVAIRADGTLWAWGNNSRGLLGDGTATERHTPVRIGMATNWLSVSVGGQWPGFGHTKAIKADGTLWAWGHGTSSSSYSPVQIGTDNNWASVSSGMGYTVAIKEDGTLWAWGRKFGAFNQLILEYGDTPIQIGRDSDWASVSAGTFHTMAIKTNGTLWAWGGNRSGELGIGTVTDHLTPIQVGSDTNWATVSACKNNGWTMAIKKDGTLWAWGINSWGNLGDGTRTNRNFPVQIGTDTSWVTMSVGNSHGMAIKKDGTLWAWGSQWGTGSSIDSYIIIIPYGNQPVQIGNDTNWASVFAGSSAIATKTDGTFWAWGDNRYGQLGDGTTVDRLTPVQINVR